MQAWAVGHPGPIDTQPIRLDERPAPEPGPRQVRIAVSVCGVCRTDLHLAEGDLAPRRAGVVPGHEVVGTVAARGEGTARFELGDRVGAAWLARTCGRCRFCTEGRENLCCDPEFTGWDRDGGFAELMVADEDYCYRLPEAMSDVDAAPLLCAGIIGYRSLLRAELRDGGHLGLYGFGGSAHLVAQLALAQGAVVSVITRSELDRELASELGCQFVGGPKDRPPTPLDAAILFAPAGELVPQALESLDRGGTLAIAGIHLSDVPPLRYHDDLFYERTLRSVTANTRADGEAFLALAARHCIRATTHDYPFDAVDAALRDLAHDRFNGAAVIRVAG